MYDILFLLVSYSYRFPKNQRSPNTNHVPSLPNGNASPSTSTSSLPQVYSGQKKRATCSGEVGWPWGEGAQIRASRSIP